MMFKTNYYDINILLNLCIVFYLNLFMIFSRTSSFYSGLKIDKRNNRNIIIFN
jgi:hypothetical protein